MSTLMPRDDDDRPIPALRPRTGGAHAVSVGAETARNATAFDATTRVVALYATGACRIRFGGAGVEADAADHYLPAGVYVHFSLGSAKAVRATHVAAIRVAGDCDLHVSEME